MFGYIKHTIDGLPGGLSYDETLTALHQYGFILYNNMPALSLKKILSFIIKYKHNGLYSAIAPTTQTLLPECTTLVELNCIKKHIPIWYNYDDMYYICVIPIKLGKTYEFIILDDKDSHWIVEEPELITMLNNNKFIYVPDSKSYLDFKPEIYRSYEPYFIDFTTFIDKIYEGIYHPDIIYDQTLKLEDVLTYTDIVKSKYIVLNIDDKFNLVFYYQNINDKYLTVKRYTEMNILIPIDILNAQIVNKKIKTYNISGSD